MALHPVLGQLARDVAILYPNLLPVMSLACRLSLAQYLGLFGDPSADRTCRRARSGKFYTLLTSGRQARHIPQLSSLGMN